MTTGGPRIGILGGGIVGIFTSLVLSELDPMIISPELGGTWASGGLKLLKHHPDIERLLDKYGVSHTSYNVSGGVWWDGEMYDLKDVPQAAQQAHYLKTRGTMEGYTDKCMNDKAEDERCFEFKYEHFIELATNELTQFRASVSAIVLKDNYVIVHTDRGASFGFDFVMSSIPLPQVKSLIQGYHLPDAECNRISVGSFKAMVRSPWKRMYVYLPGDGGVHRISRSGLVSQYWSMETTDDVCAMGTPPLIADGYWQDAIPHIQEVLPDARYVKHIGSMLGHLLPLKKPLVYPERITPIGRFASWDSRETVDVAIRKVLEWKKTWT